MSDGFIYVVIGFWVFVGSLFGWAAWTTVFWLFHHVQIGLK